MKLFSQKIRDARASLGMTQIELGKAAGLSTRIIKAYEGGEKRATDKTMYQLAKVLRVSAKYLMDDNCENPSEGLDDELALENARRITAEYNVRQMLSDNKALFAGGELSQKQKDNYFKALMAAYEACREASEKNQSE